MEIKILRIPQKEGKPTYKMTFTPPKYDLPIFFVDFNYSDVWRFLGCIRQERESYLIDSKVTSNGVRTFRIRFIL